MTSHTYRRWFHKHEQFMLGAGSIKILASITKLEYELFVFSLIIKGIGNIGHLLGLFI